MSKKISPTRGIVLLAALLFCWPSVWVRGQQPLGNENRQDVDAKTSPRDLESRLAQRAEFFPEKKSTLDQLVAIAQHYEIPMGIEWIKSGGPGELDVPLPAREGHPNVRDLLKAIVSRLPDYQMLVQNGVVHIAPPVYAVKSNNFLNVTIGEFELKDENLFGAAFSLRLSIDMTLHPEEYEGGMNGGYGYPPDHPFATKTISFSSSDLTVREILDGLIKVNGNALWVAQFDARDFSAKTTPKTLRRSKKTGVLAEGPYWNFLPFSEAPTK